MGPSQKKLHWDCCLVDYTAPVKSGHAYSSVGFSFFLTVFYIVELNWTEDMNYEIATYGTVQ